MRILHIVGDSKFGGGSVIISRLALLAKSMGWEVDCLTTDPAFQDVLRGSGIGVVPLDVIWRRISLVRDLRGLRALTSFLKTAGYDVVQTHTSKAGMIGRLAAHRAGVPRIIHTVHGFAFHEESAAVARWAYSRLERLAARWCDRIVTVSAYHRDWALRLGIGSPSQIVAIPNGVSPDRVRAVTPREVTRRSWGLTKQDCAIVTTGRLAPQKGLEYLLRSIPLLTARMGRRFRIILAGDGPLRKDLQEQARELGGTDSVVLLGFQPQLGDLLAAADLVVLPSLWEGLSIALLEAMAAGKPIVTTLIGSNREATGEGEAALLVPTKSPESLAEAILRLASDTPLAGSLGRRARERYEALYTDRRMEEAYRNIYNSL
ncbi:MAG TPA: glycosyltransferase family 4 protein [Isosphaeraceae bacterium]|nr:glycosyltransferase family 4 protein [Isosphaeraceae bacterium]